MNNKKYLLDTNILIDFMEGVPAVVEHVLQVGTQQCCMSVISIERLPYKSIEIMDPWDLGGDGKCYYHAEPTDEWFIKLMRK